jgi:hypothetical protein
MLPAETISVSIPCEWRAVYERIWRPEAFPRWASGLAGSGMRQDGNGWVATGPDGPVRIRFTAHNPFGVMDHVVEAGDAVISVPLRVVANGDGAEVMLTLFRQPGMSDERLAADMAWIRRDLAALRNLLAGEADHTAK